MLSKILKAAKDPLRAYRHASAVAKGHLYKLWYRIRFGKRVKIGEGLKINGRLSIKGPGKVFIGDNVVIGMTVTPWTYSENATISIGDNTFLNGTRFACEEFIGTGKDCIFADCRIMDTDFHGLDPTNRHEHKTGKILIGNKVWVTIASVILKNVVIGEGSTIIPNSVVTENVPNRVVYGGNPGQIIKSLD